MNLELTMLIQGLIALCVFKYYVRKVATKKDVDKIIKEIEDEQREPAK